METDSDRGKGAGLGQASWGLDQQFASKGLITSSQGWGAGHMQEGEEAPICSVYHGVNIPTTTSFKLPT